MGAELWKKAHANVSLTEFNTKSEYYEVTKISELEGYLSADNWFAGGGDFLLQ
jgi:hypothetical protein